MKNIKNIIGACLAVSLLASCDLDKITGLQDEFVLSITPDAVDSKTELNISNYEFQENGELPQNINVTFEGENSDLVYTSAGKKDFTVEDGSIVVGLKKTGVKATLENPVVVTTKINAIGFVEKEIELTFTGKELSLLSIELRSQNYQPKGVNEEDVSLNLSGGATTSETIISAVVGESTEDIEISIPSGVSFLDENGTAVNGSSLDFQVSTFESDTDAETDVFDDEFDLDEVSFENENIASKNFNINKATALSNAYYLAVSGVQVRTVNELYAKSSEKVKHINYLPNLNPLTGLPLTTADRFITKVKLFSKEPGKRIKKEVYKVINPVLFKNGKPYLETEAYMYSDFSISHFYKMEAVDIACNQVSISSSGIPLKYRFRLRNAYTNKINLNEIHLLSGPLYFGNVPRYNISKFNSGPLLVSTDNVLLDYEELMNVHNKSIKYWKGYYAELATTSPGAYALMHKTKLRRARQNKKLTKMLFRPENKIEVFINTPYGLQPRVRGKRIDVGVDTYNSLCDMSNVDLFSNNVKSFIEGSPYMPSNVTTAIPFTAALEVKCTSSKVVLVNSYIYYKEKGKSKNLLFGKTDENASITHDVPELDDNTEYVFTVEYDGKKISPPILGSLIKSEGVGIGTADLCEAIEGKK